MNSLKKTFLFLTLQINISEGARSVQQGAWNGLIILQVLCFLKFQNSNLEIALSLNILVKGIYFFNEQLLRIL